MIHVILPIDELVFFKMVIAPPTRFHLWLYFWRAIEATYDQPIPIIVNPQVHRVMLYFDSEMAPEVCKWLKSGISVICISTITIQNTCRYPIKYKCRSKCKYKYKCKYNRIQLQLQTYTYYIHTDTVYIHLFR